jgi:murein DD-endopeptidase MepM/ murein hydrolase activator NlpD
MNVILVGFSRRTRTLHLGSHRHLYALAAGVFGLVAAIFLTGYLFGTWSSGEERNSALVVRWTTELEQQRRVLERSREESENDINALALRLGEMQAQVLRLNALGSRLTGMAGLDDGEFSFDAPPALGGPVTDTQRAMEIPEFQLALDGLEQRLDTQERQLGVLADLLQQRELDSRQLPAGSPVDSGWMSSVYGQRPDPFSGKTGWHAGVDFAGQSGADIQAVADGVVSWSGARYGYGQLVEVDHGNGYRTRYAHNKENLVAVGARVRKGDVIARMGSSGRATAPNVHFEVLLDGRHVNPSKYVRSLN